MAFLKHLPCPNCGSKDNLAEYVDHFYCFGCKYWKAKNDLASIRNRLSPAVSADCDNYSLDVTNNIPVKGMQWLLQYGITKDDVDKYHLGWNNSQELLVLVNTPTYFQGRNFKDYGVKYVSRGKKPLLFYGLGDTIECVEDVLSAIKISKANKSICSTPLLGSSMPLELIQTISERFKKVLVWLDRDKAIEAVKMVRNLKQKGVDADVIVTDKDPKEYNTKEINEWLKSR